ncbi:MAG: ribulokinase [Chitinophagaceae bacterium]|nr:ribulokinase [Chitinophagaceae bacterium]
MNSYVIGVDYGTDSVRSVIVDASNGKEIASSTTYYSRWKQGLFCNSAEQQFRQHPLDYIESLEQSVKNCVKEAGADVASQIKAISVDTTGSTPVAVDESGTPLALLKEFSNNPNAMFVLWKDHTAIDEAAEINEHNAKSKTDYLKYSGGIYSSEWYWAKLLHILRSDKDVAEACYSWVEHCDWIPFLLTGGKKVSDMKRSVCAAGHKAMWAKEFGGFPPDDFFSSLDPLLSGFVSRLPNKTYTSDVSAGTISNEWSQRLGLPADTLIGVGAFDAHMGAVGGQIEPYYLSKVMGTSTCDMLVAPVEDIGKKDVKGICGQVNGSIIPGMIGLEAGQSAFGDVYAWFKQLLLWPMQLLSEKDKEKFESLIADKIISELSKKAAELSFDENSEFALDWFNGRRTPDANQALKGGITALSLGSDAPRIFRALAESTCFGAKKIVERFRDEGVEIKGLIGIGGVARKSPFIMQMMADVIGMPIKIHRSEQTCATGAAMFAATVAGIYTDVREAMKKMGTGFDITYYPDEIKGAMYKKRYQLYNKFAEFNEQMSA